MNPYVNRIIVNGFLLLLIKELFRGIQIQGAVPLILGAVILGLMNAYIRPFFIILSLPITILTLGFFTLIINAFMLRLTAFFVPGFTIYSFGAAFWGALLMSIINGLLFQRAGFQFERED